MVSQRLALLHVATGVLLVLALAGCTAPAPGSPTPRPTVSATAGSTPTPAPDPVLIAQGDATANLPYFDFVNQALLEVTPVPNGQQLVENLVAAGFTKVDMEITPDVTVGNEPTESIQFSVRINGTCLIAQTGGAGYNAIAAPLLGTGKCLVGKTRAIDF